MGEGGNLGIAAFVFVAMGKGKLSNAMPITQQPDLPGDVARMLLDFTARARAIPGVRKIRLYGSYADNRWTEDSDIDIAVFLAEEQNLQACEIYKALCLICADYPWDVQVQVFLESELANPMGIVEEVVENGVDMGFALAGYSKTEESEPR